MTLIAKSDDTFILGVHRAGRWEPNLMYVVRKYGDVEELPDAVNTAIKGDQFVCLDRKGNEVRRYARQSVMMFGHSERLKLYDARSEWKPRRALRWP